MDMQSVNAGSKQPAIFQKSMWVDIPQNTNYERSLFEASSCIYIYIYTLLLYAYFYEAPVSEKALDGKKKKT